MRLIAFVAALVGISLMAFGIWGLQAPKKVASAVNGIQKQFFSVSRAATSMAREKLEVNASEVVERKGVVPVQDSNFVPVTIEEKYSKYLYCMTAAPKKLCPGFSLESESSYYNDLREQMRSELEQYYEYLKANPLKIQEADEVFARKVLQESSPDIQEEALKIIGLFPASAENLNAISAVLKTAYDDGVMSTGLDVLTKYRGDYKFDNQIAETLSVQITTGTSDFTSVMAARRLFPFITENNVTSFRRLQKDLQHLYSKYGLRAERLEAVNSNLREYERDHLLNR